MQPSANNPNNPIIELNRINRFYPCGEGAVHALRDINLAIQKGEWVALMGPSGSGKSSLMNILGCLDVSDSGHYMLRGQAISKYSADELSSLRNQIFGFIFQRYNLLATATVQENVVLPAMYSSRAPQERDEEAFRLLNQLGLAERLHHKPSELSGGQQQKAAIARALMNNPSIILADEPTGALDSQSGKEVMDILHTLHAEGRTIILITHDEAVASHAQRIVRMCDGKIVSDSAPASTGVHDIIAEEQKLSGNVGIATTFMESAKAASRALQANMFRSALTLLGIIIGVAAVVTMMAVGDGSKHKIIREINEMGTNLLTVLPGGGANSHYMGMNATLSTDDADAIRTLPNIQYVNPERSSAFMVRADNISDVINIQGCGADMPQVRDWKISSGAFFNAHDVTRYSTVAVLGKTALKRLFPTTAIPIGKFIIIRNIPFEVIGMMAEKGAAPWGGDQDNTIFIPITTSVVRLFGQNFLSALTIKVNDASAINGVQQTIGAMIKQRHGVEDFHIHNTAALLSATAQTQNTLTTLLGTIAAIALLVGGIGVMNIMLVSVTERTREIGIRMAIGARRHDILLQFNIEAAMVCTIGGILGVALGLGAAWLISLFGTPVYYSVMPSILAFFCAFLTGLVFGYLPARKAAYLHPVMALAAD